MIAQFAMADFLLIPLTPIHIGGGDEAKLELEPYRVKDDRLEPVNLLLREGMGGLALQGAFQQQSFDRLPDKARSEDIEDVIPLAAGSAAELSKSSALRQGRVDGFQRSGGRPFLPGSSLKGALRTAWLAHCSGKLGSARFHTFQSQNKTVAARAMADRNISGQRSYRMTFPQNRDMHIVAKTIPPSTLIAGFSFAALRTADTRMSATSLRTNDEPQTQETPIQKPQHRCVPERNTVALEHPVPQPSAPSPQRPDDYPIAAWRRSRCADLGSR